MLVGEVEVLRDNEFARVTHQSRIAAIDECADARLIDRAAQRVPDVRGDNADKVFRQIRFENLFVRFDRGICAAVNNQIQNVAAEIRASDVLGVISASL